MLDTAKILCESVTGSEMALVALGENTSAYNELKLLDESYIQLLGITPEKVIVNVTKGNNYLVEFSHNLELLMRDQHVTLDEALNMIAEENEIKKENIYVVMDESCIHRVNIKKAVELGYKFVRKN